MDRRLGPFPLWGVIVVVGLAAYIVWRRRTEPGWFPTVSYPAFGGGEGTGEGFGGVASSNGGERRRSEEEEAALEPPAFISGEGSGRPTLPAPISSGGGGGGGTVESSSQVIPLMGRGGMFTYTGTSRLRGGGGGGGSGGSIGYGGGRFTRAGGSR